MNFPGTNVELTPALHRSFREECKQYPGDMTPVPMDKVGHIDQAGLKSKILKAWRSNRFLAMFCKEPNGIRLSINRTEIDTALGTWKSGISWDQLMDIKRACGYGETHAIEIYPADSAIVNVAAIRHLWLLEEPPPQLWTE